eukprot:11438640-Ditylum_brightwellii.AAC.1
MNGIVDRGVEGDKEGGNVGDEDGIFVGSIVGTVDGGNGSVDVMCHCAIALKQLRQEINKFKLGIPGCHPSLVAKSVLRGQIPPSPGRFLSVLRMGVSLAATACSGMDTVVGGMGDSNSKGGDGDEQFSLAFIIIKQHNISH